MEQEIPVQGVSQVLEAKLDNEYIVEHALWALGNICDTGKDESFKSIHSN